MPRIADTERLRALAAKLGTPLAELERKLDAIFAQQKELEKQVALFHRKQAAHVAASLDREDSKAHRRARDHRGRARLHRRRTGRDRGGAADAVQRCGRAGRRDARQRGAARLGLAAILREIRTPGKSSRPSPRSSAAKAAASPTSRAARGKIRPKSGKPSPPRRRCSSSKGALSRRAVR